MKFKKLAVALSIPLMALSLNANAGLVHTDWKEAGDQQATLSEETGLEWLKLRNTDNMSINQVKSQLDTTYAGWRLPTNNEVGELITSHFSTMTLKDNRNTKSINKNNLNLLTSAILIVKL